MHLPVLPSIALSLWRATLDGDGPLAELVSKGAAVVVADCAPASWRAVAAVATARSPGACALRTPGRREAASADAPMDAVPAVPDTNHPNVDTGACALVWRPGRGGWWTMFRR